MKYSQSKLSVVLIVKNEEGSIRSSLESVQWVDEIVILDNGSTDRTLEIASEFTDKIFQNTDWKGFGIQRQRAQSYASNDWILMIDADERVTPELRQSIEKIVSENNQNIVYKIDILPWVFGCFIRHSGWYPAPKIRFYSCYAAKYGDERVHEKLYFLKENIQIKRLKGDLLHYTYRDLQHYLEKSAKYAAEWSEQRFQKGKKASLLQAISHGSWYFFRMYILKLGFLDGKQGLLLALLSAHSVFAKYAALWVRWNDRDKNENS